VSPPGIIGDALYGVPEKDDKLRIAFQFGPRFFSGGPPSPVAAPSSFERSTSV
jgi:hypothetical protein